jgi:NADH-quinone oxidoreductase subunit N
MAEINFQAVLPEIILSLAGIAIMLAAPYLRGAGESRLAYVALAFVAVAFVSQIALWGRDDPAFFGMVFQDHFAQFSKALFIFASGFIILISRAYLEEQELRGGEFYSLLLFATVGMCLMAASADLIVMFLGLEVLSMATYVLAGFRRHAIKSVESALKYFLLGSFSTAFLLYGIALVYGAAGSTRYQPIAESIALGEYPLTLLVGMGLIIVGFGFKIAMVPFHVWTPDVYEGAPVPITAHLAVGSKAAAVITFVRVLHQVMPELSQHWQIMLSLSAMLTMVIGNVIALTQSNIKRMLAYSSIAHAGYLLVGLSAGNQLGMEAIFYYLSAYAVMSLGAFTVVQVFARKNEQHVAVTDYSGIGFRNPFLSVSLSICLISLAGIPVTGGFMGKLFLFSAAMQSQMYLVVVIGVIASAIGLYYYLRVIVLMFMGEPGGEELMVRVPMAAKIAIIVMVLGTFYLGIYPGPFLELVSEAARF